MAVDINVISPWKPGDLGMEDARYICPKDLPGIPDGWVLCHSHVIPSPINALRGARSWLSPRAKLGGVFRPCSCGMFPQHGEHYSSTREWGSETILLVKLWCALELEEGISEEDEEDWVMTVGDIEQAVFEAFRTNDLIAEAARHAGKVQRAAEFDI